MGILTKERLTPYLGVTTVGGCTFPVARATYLVELQETRLQTHKPICNSATFLILQLPVVSVLLVCGLLSQVAEVSDLRHLAQGQVALAQALRIYSYQEDPSEGF